MADGFVERIEELEKMLGQMDRDIYGDVQRNQRGLIRDMSGVEEAINRLTVVLIVFAFLVLLCLTVLVWIVFNFPFELLAVL